MDMTKITVNGYLLDAQQAKPIIDNPKYSLIIAGAGSGKTLTLIGKIKYLLENNILNPDEICCISFTNETTENLKKSILKNCNIEVPVFTFHKLALYILKKENIEFQIAHPTLLQEIIDEFFQTECKNYPEFQKIIYRKFPNFIFKNPKSWNKIISSPQFQSFKMTILTFINLMKSNNYSKTEFYSFIKSKKEVDTLLIIYAIYNLYEKEKENHSIIDFDDMILLATQIIQEKNMKLPFKLIIIDEFQDTSQLRFQLIQEIIKRNDASLCVVGDDYQSIYHFSGCDLNLFLNFSDYYPSAKIYKIETTYRNSQELIDVAGEFVQKNPSQIYKNLHSHKHLEPPIYLIYAKNKKTALEKLIAKIPNHQEILILGRNHFDLKKYLSKEDYNLTQENTLKIHKFPDKTIRYLTIHASKGLESDVVILLNLLDDIYGIPSQKKEDEILNFVKKNQPYPFEEERRLFYVALTRTKNEIYLMTNKKNPSIFVKEIKKMKHIKIWKM